jgi:hypothetical protein
VAFVQAVADTSAVAPSNRRQPVDVKENPLRSRSATQKGVTAGLYDISVHFENWFIRLKRMVSLGHVGRRRRVG